MEGRKMEETALVLRGYESLPNVIIASGLTLDNASTFCLLVQLDDLWATRLLRLLVQLDKRWAIL